MSKKHPAKELAELEADIAWWNMRIPPGYRLYGLTFRYSASIIGPNGEMENISGKFLDAIWAEAKNV